MRRKFPTILVIGSTLISGAIDIGNASTESVDEAALDIMYGRAIGSSLTFRIISAPRRASDA